MSRTVKLADLVAEGSLIYGDGYRTKKAEHGRPGLPILRVAEVFDGGIRPQYKDFVSESYRTAMGSKVSQPGDVVLTTKGTVGRVTIMPAASDPFAYSPQLCFFRIPKNSPLSPRYLLYWFKSNEFWAQAASRKSQTDMADYLNLADIGSLRLTLPDLAEQEKIASILGALDDKISVNDHVAATTLELAEAIYLQASSNHNWSSIELSSAASWHSGGTPKTSEPRFWDGEIPWISALSLKGCWIETSERRLTELGAASGTRLVPAGVVIFVVRGSSLKEEFRIGLTQREVAFGQDCKALVPLPGLDPHILFHGIRSARNQVLDLVDETSIGAGRLSTDLIAKLSIRVPPAAANDVVEEIRSLDQLSAVRTRESRGLSALRDALLPELMSGRLRVKDAEKVVEEAV